ncbi:alpha/beta hydrolase [Nonomuraea sp. M3C6]|uniref:Alpha/beta hydrolase n=1 Tax=Nonomuraea marmarensis TaxID=3351344 RepID=A0ABW7AG63_9ACTN
MTARQSHMLDVTGARLYYEVRGSGPTLLLIPGSNGDAGLYDAMADLLADHHTVISYDRRGFSRSPIQQERQAGWIETHTEDARRLLHAVAGGPSHVFGSSAGAVIGLALISRHPQQITRLVAHEPPLAELLPDAMQWRAFFQDVSTTYQSQGADAAMRKFMTGIGMDTAQRPLDPDPELISRISGNVHTILTQEVPNAPSHRPDLTALDAHHTRITLAGGRDSRDHFPYRPAATLAARWNQKITDFPGDHTGYWSHPAEFASTLVDAMGSLAL